MVEHVWITELEKRTMKANYRIVDENAERILLRDIGPWHKFATITNAAEEVVAEMAPRLEGRRLLYIDSEGKRDELLVKDGRFAGFKYVPEDRNDES